MERLWVSTLDTLQELKDNGPISEIPMLAKKIDEVIVGLEERFGDALVQRAYARYSGITERRTQAEENARKGVDPQGQVYVGGQPPAGAQQGSLLVNPQQGGYISINTGMHNHPIAMSHTHSPGFQVMGHHNPTLLQSVPPDTTARYTAPVNPPVGMVCVLYDDGFYGVM